MLHILNNVIHALHLLQSTTFWLTCVNVNIQNVLFCKKWSFPVFFMQWHRH